MDSKDERFLKFWEKWGKNRWKFIAVVGGGFGLSMTLVFAVKSVYFGTAHDSWGDYLSSPMFPTHLVGLGVFSGFIYGWFMYRYASRTHQKIKDKYNE